jgi:hypothetical protein
MTAIKLTHANLKQTMYVTRELVGGFYHSPANRCTHVVLTGGAVFPALEDEATVHRLVYGQPVTNSAESAKE